VRRVLVVLLLLLIVALIVSETILPFAVAAGLEQGLTRLFGRGEAFRVGLSSRPALKLLAGQVDRLTVEVTNVKTANLVIDSLATTTTDLRLNLANVLKGKDISVTRARGVDVTFRISEENLRRYALAEVRGLADPRVKIEPGKVMVAGTLTLAGVKRFVVVDGTFGVGGDATKIGLTVTGMRIDDVTVPEAVARKLIEIAGGADFFIDLAAFPMRLEAKEVRLEPGYLVVVAKTAP
jgi:hypothetical protein